MPTRENEHKMKPGGVKKHVESNIQNQRKSRFSNFDNFRNLTECKPPVQRQSPNKVQNRALLLQKWKEEKERKKKEAMAKKKKPFVVGTAKQSSKFEPPPHIAWPLPSSSGIMGRSQSRSHISSHVQEKKIYIFAPENAGFNPTLGDLDIPSSSMFGQKKLEPHEQIVKIPKCNTQGPRSLQSPSQVTNRIEGKQTQNPSTVSKALENNNTKKILAKKPLKEENTTSPTESSSYESHEECVREPKITRKGKKSGQTQKKDDNFMVITSTSNKKLVDISNGSTISGSTESEFENRLNSQKISTLNTVTPNKAMDVPMTPQEIEEEAREISPLVCLSRGKDNMRTETKKGIDDDKLDADVCDMSVEHFRRQLDSEITRMTEMCGMWDNILEQAPLPNAIQEAVLAAVGLARLLMSKMCQRFASLLRQSEHPEPGHQLVTTTDLQGFWDLLYLQVENVDIRFKKLEESRARGWSVADKPAATARPLRPPKSKPAARGQPAPSSRLKDIIAAARKAKQASTGDATKTFEAGFFSVQTPVRCAQPARTPAAPLPARTPASPLRRPSLLRSVLSSEANKSSTKANVNSLTPINFGLTPGETVLKSNNNTSTKATRKHLQFKLTPSSDTASDCSPIRVDGYISGVNLLDSVISPKSQDLDDSQRTSPMAHNIEKDHLHMSDALADGDTLVATDKANFDDKENRCPSRRRARLQQQDAVDIVSPVENTRRRGKTAQTLPSEGNTRFSRRNKNVLEANEENMAEDKENRGPSRSSARLQRQDAEEEATSSASCRCNPPVINTRSRRKTAETPPSEGNTRSSKRSKNVREANEENMAEDKENRGPSRSSARLQRQDAEEEATSSASCRCNPPVIYTRSRRKTAETLPSEGNTRSSKRSKNVREANEENMAEDKENRGPSRSSARLQRQDAEEEATSSASCRCNPPVIYTRSRRKTAETLPSEGNTRSSKRSKNVREANEENMAEDKENRGSSRSSTRLQRQDAEEVATPVKNTRSR